MSRLCLFSPIVILLVRRSFCVQRARYFGLWYLCGMLQAVLDPAEFRKGTRAQLMSTARAVLVCASNDVRESCTSRAGRIAEKIPTRGVSRASANKTRYLQQNGVLVHVKYSLFVYSLKLLHSHTVRICQTPNAHS